jgi:hypothetical protein
VARWERAWENKYISPNDLAAALGIQERAFNQRIDGRFARWVVTVATHRN